MTGVLLDGAGWLGGVSVAVAYVLVVTRRLSTDARLFQVLNIVGGMLLTATTVYRHALPNTVINVVWIVFGAYAMIANRRRRRRADDSAPAAACGTCAGRGIAPAEAAPEAAEPPEQHEPTDAPSRVPQSVAA